jgi:hypothetical protein
MQVAYDGKGKVQSVPLAGFRTFNILGITCVLKLEIP